MKKKKELINVFEDENEIFVVSTYPNTKLKEKYLNDTITKLKSINKKVMIASHYAVPQYIVEKVDYYLYDAYNMIDTHNHTLDSDGPDFWVETDSFRVDLIITYHASALSRIFGLAMDFIDRLGYDFFVFLESDSIYDVNDLKKFDQFKKELINQDKYFLFFSPKYSEFSWQGERVYETYCYGGRLKQFLNNFKWPITLNGWDLLIKESRYNNCMEYLLKNKFKHLENKSLIKGTLKSELLNSKIDLQTVGECSGIFYNETNPNNPILFLYNHDSLKRRTTYEIFINMNKHVIELDINNWWYNILDFNFAEKLTIKINTIREGEVYSEYVNSITESNIKNLKKFKRFKFK